MTGWAVLEALGVGIAVLLLAWILLLYVPFRWRPVGLYLFVPKLAAGAFTPLHRRHRAAARPRWGAGWLVVAGRASRPRRRGSVNRGRASGLGACRPGRRPRPRLGRPHPHPPSLQDGGPRVARTAADHP